MTTLATLAVNLTGNTSAYTKALEEAESRTGSFSTHITQFMRNAGQGLQTIGQGLLLGGATIAVGAFVGLTAGLRTVAEESMKTQGVQAQLQAVLQSTAGVAGVTTSQVNSLSDALSMQTGIDDEAITGAQSMLLTFTDIGKNVFPDTTKAVLDMATGLNGGLIPSAEQLRQQSILLGKALQDPDAGLGALHRVGVNTDELSKKFTPLMSKEQKQILILKELSTEFGGSAEAAGKTFAGQLAILQVKLGNIEQSIGDALMPALTKMLGIFVDIANSPAVQHFLDGMIKNLGKLADYLASVFEVIAKGGLMSFFKTLEDGSTYISPLLQFLGMSKDQADQWGQTLNRVANWVITNFHAIATAFQNDKGLIVGVLTALGVAVAAAAWALVAPLLPAIIVMGLIGAAAYLLYKAWTTTLAPAVQRAWSFIQQKTAAFWAWLQPVLQNLWNWLSVNVPLGIQTLATFWTTTLVPAIQSAGAWISKLITWFQGLTPVQKKLVVMIGAVVAGIALLAAGIGAIIPMIGNATKSFNPLSGGILGLIFGFAKFASAAAIVVKVLEFLGIATGPLGAGIVGLSAAISGAGASILAALAPVILTLLAIAAVAVLVYLAWTNNWFGIQEKTQAAITFIQGLIAGGMQFINDLTSGKLGLLSLIFTTAWTNIQLIFAAFQAAFHGDWYRFGELMRTVFDNACRLLAVVMNTAMQNLKTAAGNGITAIINFFKTTDWGAVGHGIIEGIAKGIIAGISIIKNAAVNAAQAALDAAKGFLGIKSPSKAFETQIGWQMAAGTAEGWKNGLNSLLQPTFGMLQPATVPAMSGVNYPAANMSGMGAAGNGGGGGANQGNDLMQMLDATIREFNLRIRTLPDDIARSNQSSIEKVLGRR